MRRAHKRRWKDSNWNKKLLNSAKETSKAYGWVCDLELADIIIPEFCPLLGLKLDHRAPSRSDNLPSIDRIDPRKGYVKGNVHVISWRANRLKSDATLEEMRSMVSGMERICADRQETEAAE